jgi:hypothetical protein
VSAKGVKLDSAVALKYLPVLAEIPRSSAAQLAKLDIFKACMLILNFLPNRRRNKPQTTTLQRRLVLEIKSLELRRTAISDFLELEAEAVRINEEVKMADSFQLKAIITAVDQLTGPMKGMQRELKGFQKEMGSLALGAAAAGTAILRCAGAARECCDRV